MSRERQKVVGKQAMRIAIVFGAAFVATALCAPAFASDGIPLKLKDHKFAPAEIHVKANVPNVIVMSNEDATAEEFDSTSLKVEKVVAGNSSGNVRLRPLE